MTNPTDARREATKVARSIAGTRWDNNESRSVAAALLRFAASELRKLGCTCDSPKALGHFQCALTRAAALEKAAEETR